MSRRTAFAGSIFGYSTGLCVPWTPPTFVSPEVYRSLTEKTTEAPAGRAFGSRGRLPPKAPSQRTREPDPEITVAYNSKGEAVSWTKGSAKYRMSSENVKIGRIDTTYVSIKATCVDCMYLESGTCYTLAGQTAAHVKTADQAADLWKETSETASEHEASALYASYGGGRIPPNTFLRLHTIGDTSTVVGAKAIARAIDDWVARGTKNKKGRDNVAYTYTHAWRRVPRSAFGSRLSVMASLNPYDNVRDPMRMGYGGMSAMVPVEKWAEHMYITPSRLHMRGGKIERSGFSRTRDEEGNVVEVNDPGGSFAFRKIEIGPEGVTDEGKTVHFVPCPAQYPIDLDIEDDDGRPIERSNYEAMVTKAVYLARKLGLYPSYEEVLRRERLISEGRKSEIRKIPGEMSLDTLKDKMRLEFDEDGYAITKGHPFYEKHREAIMEITDVVETRDGPKRVHLFPDPMSIEFRVMFRKVTKEEKRQCVACGLCFDDKFLAKRRIAIAFRPDKTSGGGLIEVKSMFRKSYEIRDQIRAGTLDAPPPLSNVRPPVKKRDKKPKIRIVERPKVRVSPAGPGLRVRPETEAEIQAAVEEEERHQAEAAMGKRRLPGALAGRKLDSRERGKLRRRGRI